MTLRVQFERERQGRSRANVARAAALGATLYGLVERSRYTPYPKELYRIADSLGWQGDPADLLQEVSDHARD